MIVVINRSSLVHRFFEEASSEGEATAQRSHIETLVQRSEEQLRVAADLLDAARDLRDELRRLLPM